MFHIQVGGKEKGGEKKQRARYGAVCLSTWGMYTGLAGFLYKGCGVFNHTVSALVVAGGEFA